MHSFVASRSAAPGAISFIEQFWGTDLSSYDPDGPLPDIEPVVDSVAPTRGVARRQQDPHEIVAGLREQATANSWSIHDLVINQTGHGGFVGTASRIADEITSFVQERAADGFILVSPITPGGLDEFVDLVVPKLQDRGVYRDTYPGSTLRENLGLPDHRPARSWSEHRAAARADGQSTGNSSVKVGANA